MCLYGIFWQEKRGDANETGRDWLCNHRMPHKRVPGSTISCEEVRGYATLKKPRRQTAVDTPKVKRRNVGKRI